MELSATPEQKEAHRKKLEAARLAASKDNYITACTQRIEAKKRNAKSEVKELQNTIGEYQKALTDKIRRFNEASFILRATESLDVDPKDYGAEYERLSAMPKIEKVIASENKIEVYTDVLFCEYKEDIYEIGAFRIDIYIETGKVRWFNLTRQLKQGKDEYGEKMMAPHIDNWGKACMGNTAEIFPNLIANYEFEAVTMIAIQFVESVNAEDSWGKYIGDWPIVGKIESEKTVATA